MKTLIFFLTFMTPVFVMAQTCIPAGPISGTLSQEGSPYFVYGDICIEAEESLLIEAGVEVFFLDWYKFIVHGELNALGTETQKITFSTPNPHKYWQGIRFIESTQNSLLTHCIIERGKTSQDKDAVPENSGGGLAIIASPNTKIQINNCLVRNNEAYYGGGIHVSGSNPRIENCEIINNTAVAGGGINLIDNATAVLLNSTITNNQATYGGGLNIYNSSPKLIANTIMYNDAIENGGGMRIVVSGAYEIRKNVIASNNARMGGGLSINNADGFYCNNTIVYNEAMLKGGGVYLYGSAQPEIMNTILFFNKSHMIIDGEQVYLQSDGCDPDFRYCDIEGGIIGFAGPGNLNYSGMFIENINKDPIFAKTKPYIYNISWNNYPWDDETKSPCIDAGCPTMQNDPDCSCCDIGARFYFQILEKPQALNPFINNPQLCFIATWTPAFGALGYYLDVAKDPDFHKFLMRDHAVTDTSCVVYAFCPGKYYYRVRSYNTGLVSEYSNVVTVDFNPLMKKSLRDISEVYSSDKRIYINIKENTSSPGQLKVYNLAGQLIGEQSVNSGLNCLTVSSVQQVVLLKMLLDGKVYQEKLLLR